MADAERGERVRRRVSREAFILLNPISLQRVGSRFGLVGGGGKAFSIIGTHRMFDPACILQGELFDFELVAVFPPVLPVPEMFDSR